MIIRTKKTKNFSVISNSFLNDENLSFKAKGLLTYLLSRPDDWKVWYSQLKNVSSDGATSVSSGMNELIKFGYIEKEVKRDNGRIIGTDYVIREDIYSEQKEDQKYVSIPVKQDVVSIENTDIVNSFPETENLILDNSDTVTVIQDNNELLNTDKQITKETKYKQQTKESLSCYSDSNTDDLYNLLCLPRVEHDTVNDIIKKAFKNYDFNYIESAILYTNDKSTGGKISQYCAYLGKCLDFGYAECYKLEEETETTKDIFKDVSIDQLKLLAGCGNILAHKELERRGY